jgi:hypothetical protein
MKGRYKKSLKAFELTAWRLPYHKGKAFGKFFKFKSKPIYQTLFDIWRPGRTPLSLPASWSSLDRLPVAATCCPSPSCFNS